MAHDGDDRRPTGEMRADSTVRDHFSKIPSLTIHNHVDSSPAQQPSTDGPRENADFLDPDTHPKVAEHVSHFSTNDDILLSSSHTSGQTVRGTFVGATIELADGNHLNDVELGGTRFTGVFFRRYQIPMPQKMSTFLAAVAQRLGAAFQSNAKKATYPWGWYTLAFVLFGTVAALAYLLANFWEPATTFADDAWLALTLQAGILLIVGTIWIMTWVSKESITIHQERTVQLDYTGENAEQRLSAIKQGRLKFLIYNTSRRYSLLHWALIGAWLSLSVWQMHLQGTGDLDQDLLKLATNPYDIVILILAGATLYLSYCARVRLKYHDENLLDKRLEQNGLTHPQELDVNAGLRQQICSAISSSESKTAAEDRPDIDQICLFIQKIVTDNSAHDLAGQLPIAVETIPQEREGDDRDGDSPAVQDDHFKLTITLQPKPEDRSWIDYFCDNHYRLVCYFRIPRDPDVDRGHEHGDDRVDMAPGLENFGAVREEFAGLSTILKSSQFGLQRQRHLLPKVKYGILATGSLLMVALAIDIVLEHQCDNISHEFHDSPEAMIAIGMLMLTLLMYFRRRVRIDDCTVDMSNYFTSCSYGSDSATTDA